MDQTVDIHKTEDQFNGVVRNIMTDKNVVPKNKKHIMEFVEWCQASSLKQTTIRKHLYSLRFIAANINMDFLKVTKDDMVVLCAKIEKQPWSSETKRAHVITCKKFFKWLRKIDDKSVYPPEVKWIDTSEKVARHKIPDDLLTEDEVMRMLNICDNIRDKAFIHLLYESGGRIGEILNIKSKHVVFDKEIGARVVLIGKTGMRRILLISSAPTLATFIDNHPNRDDPNFTETPLFLTKMNHMDKERGYRPINYNGANRLLKVLARKVGVDTKKVHPHNFRHTAASRAAKFLTEAQMKHYFGWTNGSRMPEVYVHLSGRDLEQGIRKMHGLEVKEEEKVKITIRTCGRCKMRNPPESKFCNSCGFVLSTETAMYMKTLQEKINRNAPTLLTEWMNKTPDEIREEFSLMEKNDVEKVRKMLEDSQKTMV